MLNYQPSDFCFDTKIQICLLKKFIPFTISKKFKYLETQT